MSELFKTYIIGLVIELETQQYMALLGTTDVYIETMYKNIIRRLLNNGSLRRTYFNKHKNNILNILRDNDETFIKQFL